MVILGGALKQIKVQEEAVKAYLMSSRNLSKETES